MPELGYYIGFLVDVLGQGEKLARIQKIPKSISKNDDVVQLIKDTYGVVRGIRGWFDECYAAFQSGKSPDVSAAFHSSFIKYRSANRIRLHFSDTIVHLARLKPGEKHNPGSALSSMMHAASMTMHLSLATGYPIRGAIDVGIMLDVGNGDYYGPLLQSLDFLEKKASWPRIVVGTELANHVKSSIDPQDGETIDDIIKRGFVKSCADLIDFNDDLPSLNIALKDDLDDNPALLELIQAAYAKTIDAYRKFEFDAKLGPRYNCLLRQFERSKHRWMRS